MIVSLVYEVEMANVYIQVIGNPTLIHAKADGAERNDKTNRFGIEGFQGTGDWRIQT
jgi:hypothetical protein